MKKIVASIFYLASSSALALPENFVYLKDIDPTIIQEMRYATKNNFLGRPAISYLSQSCILTRDAAVNLKNVQQAIRAQGLSLKVYDCYRPMNAVIDFVHWTLQPDDPQSKQKFYPNVAKNTLFRDGYISRMSGHTRGSTVDLTIVNAKLGQNDLEMGSTFDFFDTSSHFNARNISDNAHRNRVFLRNIMRAHNFEPYESEWWHFTLKNEPYKNSYFNFNVQ